MPALQPVPLVELGIPRGRPVGDKIRLQPLGCCAESAADDLLHFTLMQIDARTKHDGRLKPELRSSKFKVLGFDNHSCTLHGGLETAHWIQKPDPRTLLISLTTLGKELIRNKP